MSTCGPDLLKQRAGQKNKKTHTIRQKKAQFPCSITYLQIIASCLFYNGGHYRKLFIQSRYYISYFSTLKLSSHINHNRFGSRVCVSVTRCVHWVCISWHTHTHTNNPCTFSFCSAPAYLTHGHRKINVISDDKLILKHILLSLWKREMKVDLDVNMCLPSQTVIWKCCSASSHHSPATLFFCSVWMDSSFPSAACPYGTD